MAIETLINEYPGCFQPSHKRWGCLDVVYAIQPLLPALPYEPNGWDIKFLRMLARNCCFTPRARKSSTHSAKRQPAQMVTKTAFGFEFVYGSSRITQQQWLTLPSILDRDAIRVMNLHYFTN
ncbi:hypothetical protein I7I51_06732 [Histoplasma capsulatum]|uniref:Uncharacterized protein n=1 Tax=Ajellomyces capsulatus TaxID=5037 RepID=A0A8A1MIJ4_AJECA|nr:hypothetical protein I7I51_06732 [Histoplasma capsulatum]